MAMQIGLKLSLLRGQIITKGFFQPICALEFVSNVRHLVSPWLWRSSARIGAKRRPSESEKDGKVWSLCGGSYRIRIIMKSVRRKMPKQPPRFFLQSSSSLISFGHKENLPKAAANGWRHQNNEHSIENDIWKMHVYFLYSCFDCHRPLLINWMNWQHTLKKTQKSLCEVPNWETYILWTFGLSLCQKTQKKSFL